MMTQRREKMNLYLAKLIKVIDELFDVACCHLLYDTSSSLVLDHSLKLLRTEMVVLMSALFYISIVKEEDATNDATEQTPLLQKQTTEAKHNLYDELKEREAAMYKLENDIVDVNEMFRDLAIWLYIDQANNIDSIEADVDPTVSHVEAGNVNWDKARYYQEKARRRKYIDYCASETTTFEFVFGQIKGK
ncbi:syntaxin-12-like isoform X2 [Clytia hemisphaerica]|uniref:syntaxin-12-like isoform X2 n=2 Tax=Clytia hemisphaerica TaxID=252671 RepID=UPI0034D6035E